MNSLWERVVIIASFLTVINIISCQSNREAIEVAIGQAGDNASEIEKYLDWYQDSENRGIAESVVAGMIGQYGKSGAPMDSVEKLYRVLNEKNNWGFPEDVRKRGEEFCKMSLTKKYDLQSLSAEFLCSHQEDAYSQWKTRRWNKNLPEDIFLEALLPYRIGDEEPTLWREPYRAYAVELERELKNLCNSVDAARIVSGKFGPTPYNPKMKTPHRSALNLLEAPVGICREDCDRTVYAMRSFGIPVAIDQLLVSPDYGGDHLWNVVYDTDDGIYRMFDNKEYPPTRDSIHNDRRKKGKVYRNTFALQLDRLEKFEDAEFAPDYLMNPRHKDVTAEYFGKNRATVPLFSKQKEVYLGIFNAIGVKPIDIAVKSGRKATFENIEPNVIYFPIIPLSKEKFEIAGFPFLIDRKGDVRVFEPSLKDDRIAVLDRKMPVGFLMERRQKGIEGIRIYVSETENGPWRTLDTIHAQKRKIWYYVNNSKGIKERYVKLEAPDSTTKEFGEFIVATDSLGVNAIPLSIVGNPKDVKKREKLIDGDVLSRYLYKPENGPVVLKVESGEEIGSMYLLPRNDDNSVRPGDEYELLMLGKDGWRSIGKKQAVGFELEFDVPENAVFWLRDLSRGKEEQIFIIKNGQQIFNYDL